MLETQQLFLFSIRMTLSLFWRPFYISETMEQLYAIGVGSVFLITLTGLVSGQGLALAFSQELADFGAKDYLGRVMALTILRELGPILTGLMVAARVASGITAEIGTMKSTNQLDALVSFGIDPIRKIARPRLIALFISVPALTVLCDTVGLIGGWIIGIFITNVSSNMYWAAAQSNISFGSIAIGLVKPVIYGLIIAYIACYRGFTAQGGTKGVGRATTNSVMMASITILVANFLITKTLGAWLRGYY